MIKKESLANFVMSLSHIVSYCLESTAKTNSIKDILTDISMLMQTKIFMWYRRKAFEIDEIYRDSEYAIYFVRVVYGFFRYFIIIFADNRGHYTANFLRLTTRLGIHVLSKIAEEICDKVAKNH